MQDTFGKTPLIDEEQIEMLVETGEDAAAELIEELIDLFVEESEPKLEEIPGNIERGEVERVVRNAHAIAGSSANLGALRLSEIARCLERQIETLSVRDQTELFGMITACYEESVRFFRSKITELRG